MKKELEKFRREYAQELRKIKNGKDEPNYTNEEVTNLAYRTYDSTMLRYMKFHTPESLADLMSM